MGHWLNVTALRGSAQDVDTIDRKVVVGGPEEQREPIPTQPSSQEVCIRIASPYRDQREPA